MGKELIVNWIEGNYHEFAEKLREISTQLPKTHPSQFPGNEKNQHGEAFRISDFQLRDAFMRERKSLKSYFLAALNMYVSGTIDPPIVEEPEPILNPKPDITNRPASEAEDEPRQPDTSGPAPEIPAPSETL